MHRAAEAIARWRGRRVVVLATGDPMWFGGGANLARTFGPDEMAVIPHPGAFSLAAARMLWPLADVECVTVHGRPLAIAQPAHPAGRAPAGAQPRRRHAAPAAALLVGARLRAEHHHRARASGRGRASGGSTASPRAGSSRAPPTSTRSPSSAGRGRPHACCRRYPACRTSCSRTTASSPSARFAPRPSPHWRRCRARCCGMSAPAPARSPSSGCAPYRAIAPAEAARRAPSPSSATPAAAPCIARNAAALGVPQLEVVERRGAGCAGRARAAARHASSSAAARPAGPARPLLGALAVGRPPGGERRQPGSRRPADRLPAAARRRSHPPRRLPRRAGRPAHRLPAR